MNENEPSQKQHTLAYLLPLGVALGLLAQWLFIGVPLGISWFIFIIALLAALLLSGGRERLHAARRNLWLWPALLFFAVMVFLRANPFLTLLNILAALGLLTFIFYYYAAGTAIDLPLSGILAQPWRMARQLLNGIDVVARANIKPLSGRRGRGHALAPVLRGSVLALPVIIVFTLLLGSADLVFSATLQRMLGPDITLLAPYVGRGIFAILIAIPAASAMAAAILRGLHPAEDDDSWIERAARHLPLRLSIGSTETTTILLLVSALFLVFILLQFRYLFGGEDNISRAGFTYANYARRGFFELILVATLSLALILGLNWLTRRESKQQIKGFNGFSSVLIGLVLLLLGTAFWRMRLYEQAYGYTELRLYVLVFELWLGLLLIWFLVTLWLAPERFAPGFLVVILCFVGTLNLINPDALIVRHNLARYRETGDLDVSYLAGLSDDAVPDLVAAWHEIEGDDQLINLPYCYGNDCTSRMDEFLSENLNGRYESMLADDGWMDGRAYHRARVRANQALACFHAPQAAAVHLGHLKVRCPAPTSS